MSAALIASETDLRKPGALNCKAETLTATLMCAGHFAASRQALRRTHSPIGTISPFSSATGMNSLGRNDAALRMLPSQKRFERIRPACP